ncbi:MAG: radical SAM family heme chaperone HemW [Flavisolibacter sp.]
MIRALIKEIEAEKDYLKGEMVHTIYFGGGTPSLLEAADCSSIITALQKNFTISPLAEITLEANPDDIEKEKLKTWKDLGINRLSIGIQSFFGQELKWMNRAHSALQAFQSITLSKEAGFDNLSIDLIYGPPGLTDDMWYQTVHKALEFQINHLSCYALTVEEKTPLFKAIANKKGSSPDPEKQARQFLLLMDWLEKNKYEHYEISNFATAGHRSLHNSAYWKGEKYLGIGPSAHSYNGVERRWNLANNAHYLEGQNPNKKEIEVLHPTQQLNEYIMISLRTIEGLNISYVTTKWGQAAGQRLEEKLTMYIQNNLVRMNKGFACLTREGILFADGIASELFTI